MSKKFLTKLLDAGYRARVIRSISPKRLAELKIPQYARYTVDRVIIGRNKEHENDREWAYGFSPLEVLAYVSKGGSLVTKLFEFNTVNHFLRDKDGDSAVEVVAAILADWAKSDGNIRDFDIDDIDAGLKKIEDEYVEAEKVREDAAKKAEDAGRSIKEKVESAVNAVQGLPFDEAKLKADETIRPILDGLVSDGVIFKYELGYSRNTPKSKGVGEFLLDIGYQAEERGEAMILKCDVRPPETSPSSGATSTEISVRPEKA